MDSWIKFAVDNYKSYIELNQLFDAAKPKILNIANEFMFSAVKNLEDNFFTNLGYEIIEEVKNEIQWRNNEIYEKTGLYFGFSVAKDFEWITSSDKNKAGFLWLYIYKDEFSNKKIVSIRNKIKPILKENVSIKKMSAVIPKKIENDDNYISAYYLNNDMNLDLLKTPGNLSKKLENKIKAFTLNIHKILINDLKKLD